MKSSHPLPVYSSSNPTPLLDSRRGNRKEKKYASLKSGLMKVRERKSWLKAQHSENKDHGIRSHHFMGNRWGNSGNSVRLYSWGGSKITADGDCSHEIKRGLLLGRKVMTNLDSLFKSRDITLLTRFRLVKAMVFPVIMYGCDTAAAAVASVLCDSWTINKAEC